MLRGNPHSEGIYAIRCVLNVCKQHLFYLRFAATWKEEEQDLCSNFNPLRLQLYVGRFQLWVSLLWFSSWIHLPNYCLVFVCLTWLSNNIPDSISESFPVLVVAAGGTARLDSCSATGKVRVIVLCNRKIVFACARIPFDYSTHPRSLAACILAS